MQPPRRGQWGLNPSDCGLRPGPQSCRHTPPLRPPALRRPLVRARLPVAPLPSTIRRPSLVILAPAAPTHCAALFSDSGFHKTNRVLLLQNLSLRANPLLLTEF